MLRSRFRFVSRFGLWSTAITTVSSCTAKVAGTKCGRPDASAVPRRNTRAWAKRSRSSWSDSSMEARYPGRLVSHQSPSTIDQSREAGRHAAGQTRRRHQTHRRRRPAAVYTKRSADPTVLAPSPRARGAQGAVVSAAAIRSELPLHNRCHHPSYDKAPWSGYKAARQHASTAPASLGVGAVLLSHRSWWDACCPPAVPPLTPANLRIAGTSTSADDPAVNYRTASGGWGECSVQSASRRTSSG